MKEFNKEIKVFVLIPAHNEEKDIEKTLTSALSQTYLADKIVVALDNCTDNTEAIVKACGVDSFKTVGNTARKAGALNQGMGYMLETYGEPDFLLQMDADTFLDSRLIEEGIRELEVDPELGGVCNRFGIKPYEGGNKLLHIFQYLEYSYYDSVWVEKNMDTHVLSGTAVILRWEAIKNFVDEDIWDENSVVEDFRLALDLKRKGWKIKVGENMHTLTDYMPTWKSLWLQRKRWFYGTIEELLIEGWKKYTSKDILVQFYSAIIGLLSILFFVVFMIYLSLGLITEWHILGKIIIGIALIDRLYRNKYVREKTKVNMLVNLTLIPTYLYGLFLLVCYYHSAYLVFRGKPLNKW